jgi:hypothetical protein
MKTKLLMTSSSVFMGFIGIALSFMPNEVIESLGQIPITASTLTSQLTGAIYFGFAVTNWMAKGILIGGIYARPLAIGNFAHFLIAGLALVKVSLTGGNYPIYIYGLTIFFTVFAVSFGYVLIRHPLQNTK